MAREKYSKKQSTAKGGKKFHNKDGDKHKDISSEIPVIRNMKPETKRKIKWGIVVGATIALIILVTLFFLGIRIKFILNDELNIKLNPLNAVYVSEGKLPVQVNFTIVNENFGQCRSLCEFTLTDLGNGSTLYSEKKNLEHNEKVRRNLSISLPSIGSGQRIFNFEAKCSNIKTLLCLTDQKPRFRSSIIIVNYKLTEEEKKIKEELKPKIENFLQSIKNNKESIGRNRILLGRLPEEIKEKESIRKELDKIEGKVNFAVTNAERLRSLWRKEDYFALKQAYSDRYMNQTQKTEEDLLLINKEINKLINQRNNNVFFIKRISSMKDKIYETAYFYAKEPTKSNTDKLRQLSDALELVEAHYITIRQGKEFSENSIFNWLNKTYSKIKSILYDHDSVISLGEALSSLSRRAIYIKEGIGLNHTGAFECEEFNALIKNIESINNDSLEYRYSNYPESFGNKDFEDILKSFEDKIEYLSFFGSGVSLDDTSRNLITFNLENVTINNTLNVSDDEMYKMAIINNTANKIFLQENCLPGNYSVRIPENIDHLLSLNLSLITENNINNSIPEYSEAYDAVLEDNPPVCCIFNECNPCHDAGQDKNKAYPVLFIHGHTFNEENTPEYSMSAFTKIQRELQNEGFINAGELDFEDIPKNEWGRVGKPVTVRATYYYITYYDIGSYSIVAQKSERIENYAIRLREIIELLKYRTGADKVNIVAHSMGGLVAREYISLFGQDSVNKLILINTPNHGITDSIYRFCKLMGSSKECSDMKHDSIFLQRLNSRRISDVDIYAIRSTGCNMNGEEGDGIVTEESAYLDQAKNYAIEGRCTDTFNTNLHSEVLDPELYPQTLELITKILKNETIPEK